MAPLTKVTVPRLVVMSVARALPMLSIRTTVPAATVPVAVQLQALSPVLKALPVHSLSWKKITVPGGRSSSATKATLSLPSALKPTKAMEPGPRAMV